MLGYTSDDEYEWIIKIIEKQKLYWVDIQKWLFLKGEGFNRSKYNFLFMRIWDIIYLNNIK